MMARFVGLLILSLIVTLVVPFGGCSSKKEPETQASKDRPASSSTPRSAPAQAPRSASSSQSGLHIEEAVMATSVENLVPQGAGSTFPAGVQKLYCFTKIQGGGEDTQIHHVWMHKDQEIADVTLNVRGSVWRTYSTKTIDPAHTGSWKVLVKDSNGGLLKEIPFEISGGQVSEN